MKCSSLPCPCVWRNKRANLKPEQGKEYPPNQCSFSLLSGVTCLCCVASSCFSLSSKGSVSSLNAQFLQTHHSLFPFHVFNRRLSFLCSLLFRVEVVSNPKSSPYPLYIFAFPFCSFLFPLPKRRLL